ncbi:MAG: hypothetical protein WC755_08025, partial [Candidatus Woesearchaeota archaeon]
QYNFIVEYYNASKGDIVTVDIKEEANDHCYAEDTVPQQEGGGHGPGPGPGPSPTPTPGPGPSPTPTPGPGPNPTPTPQPQPEEQQPGKPALQKDATMNFNGTNSTYIPAQDIHANYFITYWNYDSGYTNVTVTDTLGINGIINARVNGTEFTGDTIIKPPTKSWVEWERYYHDSYDPEHDDQNVISECKEDTEILCYEAGSTIYRPEGIIFRNLNLNDIIIIRYQGKVNLGNYKCGKDNCNIEEFINTAYSNSTGGRPDETNLTDDAVLYGICKYFITRNSGDVMLYTPLEDTGADLSCLTTDEIRNTTGLAITPKATKTKLPSTGIDVDKLTPSLCDSLESNSKVISGFSSYLCELAFEIFDKWKPDTISKNISTHTTPIMRHNENLNFQSATNDLSISSFAELETLLMLSPNPNSNVFRKTDGGNLILNGLKIGNGAYTFIVENGDIIINSNIEYAANTSTEYGKIPSLAFIVKGGNIKIDNQVTKLVGVYYVEQMNGKGGNIGPISAKSTKQLIIYGSVFGNIDPLLKARNYIGDPMRDGASVKIIYDDRIHLNTPPGLSDFIDTELIEKVR